MTGPIRQVNQYLTFDRMLWSMAACALMWGFSAQAENVPKIPSRFSLTPSQIVDEMQHRQLPTSEVQVRLAAPITSATANPPLEIQAVAMLSSHQVRLRMTCRDRSECLPFFATATYPRELSASSISMKQDDPSSSRILPRSAAEAATEIPAVSAIQKQIGPVGQLMMRSGSPATLELDQDRVHIHIEVICLESGVAGDKIRVTSHDHKQVYFAKIVSPTLLKGSF